MVRRMLLVLIAVLGFTKASFAEELDTERKELQGLFITERASSQQEKGEWQFRGDFEYRHDRTTKLKQYRTPIALEYGIWDWLELDLGIPYVWQKKDSEGTDSFGNLNAGLTFLLVKGNKEIPYIATGFEIGFPTVQENQDITGEEEKYKYEGFVNMTKYFPLFITDINFAYSQSRNGEHEEELEYNIGADFLLDKIFKKGSFAGRHFTAEFNGETNLDNNVDKFYLTPGVKYVTKGGLEWGLGVPIGLVTEADEFKVISSLTFEWGG